MAIILDQLNFRSIRKCTARDRWTLLSQLLKHQIDQLVDVRCAEINIADRRVQTRNTCVVKAYRENVFAFLGKSTTLRLLYFMISPILRYIGLRSEYYAEFGFVTVYFLQVLE